MKQGCHWGLCYSSAFLTTNTCQTPNLAEKLQRNALKALNASPEQELNFTQRVCLLIHSQPPDFQQGQTGRGFALGSPGAAPPHLGAPRAAGSPRCCRVAPARHRPPAPGPAGRTAPPGSSCQSTPKPSAGHRDTLGVTLHTPTACSTCTGCLGSASKALGYNLLLLLPGKRKWCLSPSSGCWHCSAPSTAPHRQPQPAVPRSQRSCGGTRQGGAGVSSGKPKPGAVPALWENQAQSEVSTGQRK